MKEKFYIRDYDSENTVKEMEFEDGHEFYEYCVQHNIIQLKVIPSRKYSKIAYDAITFSGSEKKNYNLISIFNKFYDDYCRESKIGNNYEAIGGGRNKIFKVMNEDMPKVLQDFAREMYDYSDRF